MKKHFELQEYYNKRFREQFNEWVKKTDHSHESPYEEGIYIPHINLNPEKLSHIPKEDIPFFFCSLGWSVLIDQVMYTYFKKDYPKFQSMTLYPKIEMGITGINERPDYVFKGFLTKDIIKFFLLDLKQFFKENKFEEANWESITKVMLEDKDVNIYIKEEILKIKQL